MNGNKIVSSLWISNEIGLFQRLCINSYLKNGHEFYLYVYGEVSGLPRGVKIKDANEIISRERVFIDNKNSYATFSDWFRIALLYKLGGWWVDADTVCLKKFDFRSKYVFATEISLYNSKPQCCNAIIKMPKNSELGRVLLDEIEVFLKSTSIKDIHWTEIGAQLLFQKILDLNLHKYFLLPEVFCRVNFINFKDFLELDFRFDDSNYAVHLWNKMWDWSNLSFETKGKSNCILEQLKQKYLD